MSGRGGYTPPAGPEMGPELPGMTCLGRLGSGGFADVYLYERHRPRIRVAVKLMRQPTLNSAQLRQFAAEADAMAELAEHPYIVGVHSAGTTADGRPYLVMQYYPSADLAARVRRSPMSVPDALRFGIQLASAVETAHRSGIIHRDIKPSNVLLTSYGVPGLSDFGIAGRPGDADEEIGVSMPWSPPEVLTGASTGSPASDVYSLAATIWHLLVGRTPFARRGGDNSDHAIFSRIVHESPPVTGRTDVPASLDRLLQQAMAKVPAHRPQSALELARQFQRIEQELRLDRTEIVVLDREGPAAPTDPILPPSHTLGRPGAATAGRHPEESATVRKAPTRISAQQPPRQPTAYELPPTSARPKLSKDPSTEPGAGRRGPVIAAIVALLVVAVVVGLFLTRGGTPGDGGDEPSPPVDTKLPGVGSGPPAPTRIAGRIVHGRAVFSWKRVPGATGYQWTTMSGGQRSGRVTAPTVSLKLQGTGRLCIDVRTLSAVAGSQGATRGCAG